MRLSANPLPAFALAFAALPLAAQTGTGPAAGAKDGLLLGQDSTFRLEFRFRMQDRATYQHLEEAGAGEDSYDFQVRRFRLKFEGFAVSPRLEYKVQLGLAQRDMAVGDGESDPSPLLDAMVLYRLAPYTKLGFGQGKLPGGRQALISSGDLELPERPLANSAFSADRDIGLFAWQKIPMGGQQLRVMAAATQGEGRATAQPNQGLCYTGRLEWLPWGAFTGQGEYVEGDLQREARPKLALAAAYSADRHARRARAQLGPQFAQGQERTIRTFYADAYFKHQGWACQTEFNQRMAEGDPAVTDTANGTRTTVNEGWGFTAQLGRMLGPRSEVAARYSTVRPGPALQPDHHGQEEVMLGYAYYLRGHRIKLQAAAFGNRVLGTTPPNTAGRAIGAMFQVEMGI